MYKDVYFGVWYLTCDVLHVDALVRKLSGALHMLGVESVYMYICGIFFLYIHRYIYSCI